MESVTLDDIERLKNSIGVRRSAEVIKALGKQIPLLTALATEPGKLILSTAISRTGELLEKIINEQATEQERAEYRVLRIILADWSGKIANYFKLHETMKGK